MAASVSAASSEVPASRTSCRSAKDPGDGSTSNVSGTTATSRSGISACNWVLSVSVATTTAPAFRHAASSARRAAIASDSTETRIGTFYAGGPFGIGTLFLSTRNGDEIPGGGVLELSGQDVEVRGSDGTAVLAGRFPILE